MQKQLAQPGVRSHAMGPEVRIKTVRNVLVIRETGSFVPCLIPWIFIIQVMERTMREEMAPNLQEWMQFATPEGLCPLMHRL